MKNIDLKYLEKVWCFIRTKQVTIFLELLVVVLISLYFSSTTVTNNRRLKKFVSRFNAGEYACASTYIYPDDRMRLAFFANEVRNKVPHAFVEIEDCKSENNNVVATLKWKNANDFLRIYFANIGKPLGKGDILFDTLKIRETLDGECFSFDWGSPKLNTEKLRLASISAEDVEWMNIRTDSSTNSQIIGKLGKGNDILIEAEGNDWSRCYIVNNSQIQTGYIYTGYLSVKESAFSSLSIFDSMSLLVAMIVIVVICVPLYLLRGAVESIMMSGCTGMASAVILVIILLYVIYQLIEKILFELFIINLPY